MTVDIYIRERNGSREIRVPWLPEAIEFKTGGTTRAKYDIMNRGPVVVPMGSELVGYSWASAFPGKNRTDSSMLRGPWNDPKIYHNLLEYWRENGTPLYLLVTGYPINKNVIIDDYFGKAAGGFGDIEYTISFIEDRDIVISSTKVDPPQRPISTYDTYTVKSGDTLWSIAEKLLGSGTKWKAIYEANKEIIESTAKKRWKAAGIDRDSQNGHWIFPGTVLTIPDTSNTGGSGGSGGSGGGGGGGGGGGTPVSSKKTYKLTVENTGDSAYRGRYTVWVNAKLAASEQGTKNKVVSAKDGDKVEIVPVATGGHSFILSLKKFYIHDNTRVLITWTK